MNLFISARRRPHSDPHTYLGTVFHNRIKEYPQSILFEPQCFRYEIDELVAQFLTLREVSQEIPFETRDVLFLVPLKTTPVRTMRD